MASRSLSIFWVYDQQKETRLQFYCDLMQLAIEKKISVNMKDLD